MATITQTTTTDDVRTPPLPLRGSGQRRIDLSRYPKLSREQAGHLRHFHNLASQPLNEWHRMGSLEPAQEFLDAYRYQLATMAYGTAAAHYHRLPALRGPLKKLMRDLIGKMLHRSVWGYWFTTSLGGKLLDPSLTEYRKPFADPVVRENIMYSGHLLLMVSLYAMLFDDDEFEKPGALTFTWDPIFFGFGTEVFEYDTKKLQAAIVAEMERNNWIGVCCEPNAVFVVCNQFPLIAMRYNDVRWGTDAITPTLQKYTKAWNTKGGMAGKNGLYRDMWLVKQDINIDATDFGFSAWANAFMNSWNSEVVADIYTKQNLGSIVRVGTGAQESFILNPPVVANEYRQIVQKQGEDKGDEAEIQAEARQRAKEIVAKNPAPMSYTKPILGYAMQCVSELGGETELQGLLRYADQHLNPTWDMGGLYYPRNDSAMDAELNWTHVSPFCGNAALGYARLNVANGQKKMWEEPWSKEEVAQTPYIDGVDMSDGIDFLRGTWDGEDQCLVVTLRTWHDDVTQSVSVRANNLPKGLWEVVVDGVVVDQVTLSAQGTILLPLEVGGDEKNILYIRTGD